ncbi:hypothetical protein K502DRAFT_83838 [Neoconidiobolus thromboides FSU 785]|nr:hypothetical protein K502DRAFT_83838 [Neoconidiobolus thromboides FSU 785]
MTPSELNKKLLEEIYDRAAKNRQLLEQKEKKMNFNNENEDDGNKEPNVNNELEDKEDSGRNSENDLNESNDDGNKNKKESNNIMKSIINEFFKPKNNVNLNKSNFVHDEDQSVVSSTQTTPPTNIRAFQTTPPTNIRSGSFGDDLGGHFGRGFKQVDDLLDEDMILDSRSPIPDMNFDFNDSENEFDDKNEVINNNTVESDEEQEEIINYRRKVGIEIEQGEVEDTNHDSGLVRLKKKADIIAKRKEREELDKSIMKNFVIAEADEEDEYGEIVINHSDEEDEDIDIDDTMSITSDFVEVDQNKLRELNL